MRYVDELTEAIKSQLALAYRTKDLLGYGLRQRLREGYGKDDLRADLKAALLVTIIALPLSMALAVAADVAPQHGLYTAIVAGIVCALLGGTRMMVTGPTATFVVVLLPIVHRFGLAGLLLATSMAGVILILMGLARLGRLMQFIPHPVTLGFTAGIAVVIALLQLKDVMGVQLPRTDGIADYLGALWRARGGVQWLDVAVAAVTLGLLVAVPRVVRRVPAPIIALAVVAIGCVVLGHVVDGFHVTTIGSKFQTTVHGETVRGIPPLPPMPMVPWHPGGGEAELTLSYATIKALLPSAFTIAMLAAIASLMTAVVSDGMASTKHDPNAELIALGVANVVTPFFGGITATGAIARTATNIRAGARSPFSVVFQSLMILLCMIALAPLVAYLPMAALAAMLLIVARNMADVPHFTHIMRVAPRSDVAVLLTCFALTVVFDMVLAVSVGVVLAALLFMRRMAVLTKVTLDDAPPELVGEVPSGVKLYNVAGPMFFGAANNAMEALTTTGADARVVILSMRSVPAIDATGLVALQSAIARLHRKRCKVIFAGLNAELADFLKQAGVNRDPGKIGYAPDVESAFSMAIVHLARPM